MHNTKTKNQIPMGIRKETSQKRKENKNNMAKYETMTIPEFVEEPNTKNEWSDFEEMADPFDSKNGELVEKKVKIGKQTLAKIKKINLALGNGILS